MSPSVYLDKILADGTGAPKMKKHRLIVGRVCQAKSEKTDSKDEQN